MAIDLDNRRIEPLLQLAAKLLDSRKHGTDLRSLARDMLRGFHDVCLAAGLDRVVVELGQQLGVDGAERSALADDDSVVASVVAQLSTKELDGGGARNAKPRQVVDSLVAAIGLSLVADDRPTTTLSGEVRAAVAAAVASVVDAALATPRLRDAIVADARARTSPAVSAAFSKVVAELDERGLQMNRQPKIPIDAMQAIQAALREAREAVIGAAVREGIDRARDVIAATDPEVAARIDEPVSLSLTPREVVIRRINDVRVIKTPANVVDQVVSGLGELARITWKAAEPTVLRYAASATFAVGDVIEHVKFGRGSVVGLHTTRIDVEFADGKRTLAHAPARS